MNETKPSFKTKIIYGLVVTVPLAILIIILAKLIEILNNVAKLTGLNSTLGAAFAVILAVLLTLLICYITGSLLYTRFGAASFYKLEKKILMQIPGYLIIKNILKGFTEGQIEAYKPVMIEPGQPGVMVLGFAMEENDNDTITVFVPSVPAATIGGLYIVEKSRVKLLEASHMQTINCITEWGIGSNKLFGKNPV